MKMFNNKLTLKITFSLLMVFSLFSTNSLFAQQANEDCSNAIAISCGDIITGSNEGASADDATCNTQFSQHGVWYTIVGNGGDLTLSTCNQGSNFDTQIAVFTGGCDGMTCVDGNNNGGGCTVNSRLSTVTIPTTSGTTYYVLVNGVVGASGTFVLSAECGASPIENDSCDGAEDISCGDVVTASTVGASNEPGLNFCGTSLTSAPGIWYHMAGTGDNVTASLCGSSFDTKIGIFSGSCDGLSCVAGNDDNFSACGSGFRSEVDFVAENGVDYYIYVTGFSSNAGDIELAITCAPIVTVSNDDCASAEAINCGDTVVGSTAAASSESLAFCGTSLSSAPGVWYSIEGTGGSMTASLCGSSFDTKIGVFDGSCGTLSCVAGNDDNFAACGSGFRSQVDFDTDEGVTYYIYVTGFSSNAGDFELVMTCADVEGPTATCANAETVGCDDVASGDTSNGQVNDLSTCNGVDLSTATGIWYTIEGNDLLVQVDVDGHGYDAQVGIFSGSCDDLTCVTANNNASPSTRDASASFEAIAGTTYYIYVTGLLGSAGEYDMSISCTILNDNCASAEAISCGDTVNGSTESATANNDTPYCGGSYFNRRTAWYSIMGDGSDITISLCGSSYDTKVGVFDGACGFLSCVEGNDDDCGLQSEVVFASTDGVMYYIAVSGWSSSSYGDYELVVSCSGAPSGDGDTCGEAINLPVGATCVNVTASNDGATDSGEGSPTCAFYQGGDVWFALTVPMSGEIIVETSGASGFTDSGMAAYTGSCGSLTQIGCNDDGGPGLFSKLELSGLTAGSTIYVRVWEYGNNNFGDFNICAYEPIITGPITNDDCASAIALGVSPDGPSCTATTASNDGATDSGIANPGCANYSGGDVWFSILIPTSGNVDITTSSAGGISDSGMAVYNGSCGSLNLVACNDDGNGLFSFISLTNQVAGTTLWIRVWEYGNNDFGNFNICAQEVAPPPARGEANTSTFASIYPNPISAGQIANIDLNVENDSHSNILISDNTGRTVRTLETELFAGKNSVAIQTTDLAAGTYFVSLKIGEQIIHKKLIIVK